MRQVLFGGVNNTLTAITATYASLIGAPSYLTVENTTQAPWSAPGVFRNLVIELSVAPGVGNSRTVALRIAGANTALTVTVSDASTTARLTGVDVAMTAGQLLSLGFTGTGTPPATGVRWSLEFEGSNANESGYSGAIGGFSAATARYTGVFNPTGLLSTVAADNRQIVAAAGTLTRTDVFVTVSPGVGNGLTWYVNKNGVRQDGTAGTPNTACALVGAITQASGTYSLPLSPGDVVYLEYALTGSVTTRNYGVGTAFTATTAGQSHVCGGQGAATNTNAVYVPANSALGGNKVAETDFFAGALPGVTSITLSGLRVLLSVAPTTGKSRLVDLRSAGASVGPTVTIADAATTGSDLVATATIVDGPDRWNIRTVPSGTSFPAQNVYWSLIQASGAALVPVPNVVGLTQAAATTAITAAGLVLGTVTPATSATVPIGSVISQSPAATASLAPGSAVNLVVSTGVATGRLPIIGSSVTATTGTGQTIVIMLNLP